VLEVEHTVSVSVWPPEVTETSLKLKNSRHRTFKATRDTTMIRPTVSVNRKSWAASKSINTTIKTTSVCEGDARSVGGGRGWLAGDTDGLAGDGWRWAWSASQQQTLSGTGARLYTAHRAW